MSGYLLARSHVSLGGGVTGPIFISAMGWRLDLCCAIEKVRSLLGLAHPGRDLLSRQTSVVTRTAVGADLWLAVMGTRCKGHYFN